MHALQNRLAALAAGFGYTIVPTWRLDSLPLERHLQRLFAHLAIDCAFDVGANLGQYATFLRRQVGYRGLIVSVEPVAAHVARLRERAAGDPLWQVHGVALGAAPGRLPINVMQAGDLTSFLQPDASQVPGLAELHRTVATEAVALTTFDALLAEVRRTHPARRVYLKLDTQGYDLEVLRGMQEGADAVLALQSEMSVIPIYHGMPDHITALQALLARGFVLSNMFPVTHEAHTKLVEFDCIMVRP